MGNANSTPAKDGAEAGSSGNPALAIKRHHSMQTSQDPHSTASPSIRVPLGERQPGAGRLSRTASIFGRASSHDGASTPQRSRSRSGSLTGFLINQRRGSATAAATAATAATAGGTASAAASPGSTHDTSARKQNVFQDAAPSTSPTSSATQQLQQQHQQLGLANYEISSPSAPGSGIETAIRSNSMGPGRARRLTEGLGMPASPGGFDPRNFVSPHPSPSVATHAHYASGLPSHHAAVAVSSGLRVSSGADSPADSTAFSYRASEPQQVPGSVARAPTRHPLFGIGGGTSMFPNTSTSLGTNAAASPPVGGSSPVLSSQPFGLGDNETAQDFDNSSNRPLAALPSYLKIPTAIPSSHVSPSSPPGSIYSQHSDRGHQDQLRSSSPSPVPSTHVGEDGRLRPVGGVGGAGAALPQLNTVDVLIPPGDASKTTSPIDERKASIGSADGAHTYSEHNVDAARAAGVDVTDLPVASPNEESRPTAALEASKSSDATQTYSAETSEVPEVAVDAERVSRSMERTSDGATAGNHAPVTSRTPTPTPSTYGPRAMTPTRKDSSGLRSLSPATGPATSTGPPSNPISTRRRSHVDVQTGGESGYNTPLLPPGLTSAPPSASTPGMTPLTELQVSTPASTVDSEPGTLSSQPPTPSRPLSGAASTASQPTTPSGPHPNALQQQQYQHHSHHHHSHSGHGSHHTHHHPQTGAPLMPIALTWRAGGREVFVTGTFANEWRSKILLHRSKRDHTCVLHLPPGTHRLKFIVDDRWRVSRDLPTATDGDGNLVNYVEIPNVGPAHPGPLSAPGEDFAESNADKPRSERGSKIDSKRTTMNLVEEARRAEAARLDDFFDDDGKDQEETWTSEIPAALIEAQEAEEAYREAIESGQPPQHSASHGSQQELPNPPALPRQLEKVILNSSPANPSNGGGTAGSTVDDNSILPAPNHVVLNHLTASSIKGGVLAVGTTTRYKRKYVTTVYYRPVQV